MALNTQPIAVGTPKNGAIQVSTAQVSRDGTVATLSPLYGAGLNGALIASVRAIHGGPVATLSTAMSLRLWLVLASGTKTMIDEVLLPAVTPTTLGVPAAAVTFSETNITLGAGDTLSVSQSFAEPVYYAAKRGGEF